MKALAEYTRSQKLVYRWLITGCVMIMLIVVIGGVTRLTQSGLSMVKWEPIVGTLPPLSNQEWTEAFDLYKASPEFEHYNSNFTLADFKKIFFWEYLHRLIARLIGLVFIVPCIFFWVKGYFNTEMKKKVVIIFVLGVMQAIIGWFMVKSGLVDEPHVSHYRLATHLITALTLIIYIFWVALSLKYGKSEFKSRAGFYLKLFIAVVFIQLIYGAFVAGLKAGLYYNTFPKMGENWIPAGSSLIIKKEGGLALMENPVLVQFIHRILAFLLLILLGVFWIRKNYVSFLHQKRALYGLTIAVILQITLGIVTLLYRVPVTLGVLHQFVGMLVLLSAFYFLFTLGKRTVPQGQY
ncbi:MAG: COX15/CtaA family protein [Crocinitomicaceae bacterium]|nr:COX15/CtaA family protein [Crocinitomicaceae bacterium]